MATLVSTPAMNPEVSTFISRKQKLFINGKWVDAASGKTFPTYDPSTGEVLAQVAEADREDIDRAVKAARAAFETGPWSKMSPAKRGNLIWKLADLIEQHLDPPDAEPEFAWTGRVAAGTALAFMRRLRAAEARIGRLIRPGGRRVDRLARTICVVDIHKLADFAQRFVVGAILDEVFADKEATGQRQPLQVVLLDELNKYAPREGHSPIKETLVDIAQRGRSLGIILIGAQQTASRVAPEVVENASIRVTGRLDAAEAERSEYGWMLPSTRARARLFKPGTMVLFQPGIPAPLVFTFPFPPWATRKEEAVAEDDPFEGLS